MTMRRRHFSRASGFTIVELLMALMVGAIILSAVATLAFAMTSANDITDQIGQKQAQLRYSTMKISDIISNANLAVEVSSPRTGIAFWQDENADGQINGFELAYIEDVPEDSSIEIVEFPDLMSTTTISNLRTGDGRLYLAEMCDQTYSPVITECENVLFSLKSNDDDDIVTVAFDLTQGDDTTTYRITGVMRASADYLTNASGFLVPTDDDLE